MASNLETREVAYRDAMRSGRIKMLALLLVCAAPVIASYVTYYVIRPDARVNYGTLLEPVRTLPDLSLRMLDDKPFRLADFQGKWLLLTFDAADCVDQCREKLFKMRQLRTMQGKERERIERVWVITDDAPLSTQTIREQDGVKLLRAGGSHVEEAFPAAGRRADHIYLIDPLGNLVLRFPKGADPMRVNRDLTRLLKYSRVG